MSREGKSLWADGVADQHLRRLAGEGYSAAQIAEALSHKGWFVSKAAVIGRAHRTGVNLGQGRVVVTPVERVERRREQDAANARRRRAERRESAPSPAPAPKPVTGRKRISGGALPPLPLAADVPAEEVGGIAFASPDLRHDACRWPLRGEGLGLVVCGDRTGEGASYCAAHHRMAYVRGTAREPRPAYDVHVMPARSSKRHEADLVDAFAGGRAA
ncbi:GcrA family cell cycle regulator [Xanthobacter sp. 91]|uniref:GcrA family cell cycle regulator n=1 Tax=Xanthobacter sp. 91 TaxID=1117244 RepID=UPI0004960D8E|nr:GcrA family cell cycle regulator [Xanthobacter sp. 91]